MPELPEVETIRQYLAGVLPGQTVTAVRHLDPRMVKDGSLGAAAIIVRLPGLTVARVVRRGKFLFIGWTQGGHLLIHLGMSGRLGFAPVAEPTPHTHLLLAFTHGELQLVDPRRFGRVGWVAAGEVLRPGLGVEPLSRGFTRTFLMTRLLGRTAPIKSVLLDQRIVAGIGNIYADEALFRAGIHPRTPAGELSAVQTARLVRGVRAVLREGLANRGTSFSDYVDALGRAGDNQHYLRVYGRGGEPCRRCRAMVATMVIQGRTSHFCPTCQPLRPGLFDQEGRDNRAEI
ncbi:MAG: bifunctional DNA-formamidopyrimidine glycosylase/DNA-(apurinic or apyrimidinic site) lyase [Thermaerobacter sp.]|nr:bifunctional DNA-formamidopyrimidine glycosylase/DNA-(apurinic or apyrimidinic site) lyase [Thermaerobacter sp.]